MSTETKACDRDYRSLCSPCSIFGFCETRRTKAVLEDEIACSQFLADLRNFCCSLQIPSDRWRETLFDFYRDYPGVIVDISDQEIDLDMETFEFDSAREWFRDFACTPVPIHARVHVRREAVARVCVLATILKARFPTAAMLWGVRAANDNRP